MPSVISSASLWASYSGALTAGGQGTPASATGPAANEAQYLPFMVTQTATFTRGFWWNGSVATNAGNVAVGIYDEAGVRLATTGAVAASGNSVVQSAAFAASVTLSPGMYYMAISFSGAAGANATTANAASLPIGRSSGMYRQAVGSHPLPTNATFATWTSQVVPVFGITTTSFAI